MQYVIGYKAEKLYDEKARAKARRLQTKIDVESFFREARWIEWIPLYDDETETTFHWYACVCVRAPRLIYWIDALKFGERKATDVVNYQVFWDAEEQKRFVG